MSEASASSKGKQFINQKLSGIEASDIMIPRSDVIIISFDSDFDEIINIIIKYGYSRYPVYKERTDNIEGILYAKDLLKFFKYDVSNFKLENILREAIFVSENKRTDELLAEFKEKKIHIAIVVDEFGNFTGIVTLEDVIEEIIGDIEDEFDSSDSYNLVKIQETKNGFVLHPRVTIEEFNKKFKTRIKSEDFDTIGGFVISEFGYVPQAGEELRFKNYTIKILEVDGSKIKKILLKKDKQ